MKKTVVVLVVALVLIGSAFAGEPEPPPGSLATVKRVFVEQLGGGQTSDQMRDMIIAAIQNSGLFVITENEQRADAIIKGSADDHIFTEEHNTSDSIGVHANSATGSSSGNQMAGSVSSHRSVGTGISDTESSHIQDRRHEASASIRLVVGDGDVIWSTTQESGGGKFRGAMADVADKIIRQLTADVRKARQPAVTKTVLPPKQ
jgi:predicted Zn-dependent protease